jgi:hypothetical protein
VSGYEGRDAVAAYLASKGMPVTGENVRRALEMNAANPGLIKGLVNQAPPPPDAQSAPSRSQSQPRPQAQRQPQPQPQPQPTQPTQPQAMSDSASSQPTQQTASGGGSGNVLTQLVQAILSGAGGAGLASLFMGGRGGAQPPIGELGIPMPGGDPQLGGRAALPAPQAALPAPSPIGGPAQIGGPASLVPGVNPIGPPQPGRIEPGPSSPVPQPSQPIAMPRNTGQSMVMQGAPTSAAMTGGGRVASPVELPQALDWGKILGDISHVVHR